MKQLNVRLPDELHEALKALAETEHRSLNAQIIAMLERDVKPGSFTPTDESGGTN